MLYKIGVLKILQDLQENTAVQEAIFKFILKFILKSVLKISSCEFCEIFKRSFFYKTPPDDCFWSGSSYILFIGMRNIWKVSLLVTKHPFLLKLFSIDLIIFFGMFLIVLEMIFRLIIFKSAATDRRYFARNKLSMSSVPNKNFSLLWQIVFKLEYIFCQEREDTAFNFEWIWRKVVNDNNSR